MVAESFTLVRAHGVRKVGEGGGTEHEEIEVFLVPRAEIPAFVASRRALGVSIDVKLLNFLNF
jgi:ADP-ribose pyrophosphatase